MASYTPVLSSIKMPSGNVYYFKDSWAREQIESIVKYSGYLGVTSTKLTDQCTTNPILIAGEWVTAKPGNITIYGQKEFIFAAIDIDGVTVELWQELGDISSILDLLGKMAYNDTGKVVIKPKGTVSAQLFSGVEGTIDIEYTPSGEIQAVFNGSSKSIQVTGVPQGIIQMAEIIAAADGNYTPSGTIQNNIQVDAPTVNINSITNVGTLPTFLVNTSNRGILNVNVPQGELLNLYYDNSMISWDAGTLPTIEGVSVVSNVDVSIDSEFIGTTVKIEPSFIGKSTIFTGDYTPSGTITADFIGSSSTISTTFIPSGNISRAEFEGTQEEYTVYPTHEPEES